MEIRKGLYGLPQAGILANKLLQKRLTKYGYFEVIHTTGLWRHKWRLLTSTLVVDGFGVTYVGEEHVHHLVRALKESTYRVEKNWTGDLYCGITLDWNYEKRYVDV